MNSTVRWLGVFAGLCFAMPAMAGESAALKCTGSQDRVWLYDSLVSFEVQAKLKCGDAVEILSREKGFVKVRTQSGAEGYVPDVSLPKPMTEDTRQEKPVAELSLAEQARAARAAHTSSASAAANSPHAVPAAVAATPANDRSAESKIAVAEERPAESLQPVAVSSNSANSGVVSAITVETSVTPSNTPVASQPPAVAATHPAAGSTDSSASKTSSQKSDKAASKARAAQPVPVKPVRPAPAPPSSTSSASNVAPAPLTPGNGQRAAIVASNSASMAPRTVTAVETNSITLRSEPVATTRTVAATTEPESEDYPERLIEDESANPSCQTYFSAYGLSPMQYKWIVENRRKKYPGICPASTPSKVDFVVILTHDVAFYNSTMPNPVHVDRNGFSDWNPMTRADDTVVSASELDKSKHEYVWVFQMKRGAFDPEKFSPRRRPQFTKAESNGLSSRAAPRTVDDAFQFMQTAPPR